MTVKTILAISFLSALTGLIFLFDKIVYKLEAERLEYVFASNPRALSTNPLHSNSVVNLAHMEHLVGTLIKQGQSGRYEPYLSSSWNVNSDRSIWTFNLRRDVKCDDGEEINPAGFKKALEQNIHAYLSGPLPVIDGLKGFRAFRAGDKDIAGIVATADSIVLSLKPPKGRITGVFVHAVLWILLFRQLRLFWNMEERQADRFFGFLSINSNIE